MIKRIKAALSRKRAPVATPPAFVPALPDPREWAESFAASFPDPREWAASLAASMPAPDALVPDLPSPHAYVASIFTENNASMAEALGEPEWRVLLGDLGLHATDTNTSIDELLVQVDDASRFVHRVVADIDAQTRPHVPLALLKRAAMCNPAIAWEIGRYEPTLCEATKRAQGSNTGFRSGAVAYLNEVLDVAAGSADTYARGAGAARLASEHPRGLFRHIELDLCEPKLARTGIARLAAALESSTDTQLADLVVANGSRFFDYYERMAATSDAGPYLRGAAEAFASVVCTAYERSTGQVPQAWAQRAATVEPPGHTLG